MRRPWSLRVIENGFVDEEEEDAKAAVVLEAGPVELQGVKLGNTGDGTVKRLGEGGSTSSRSWRRRNGGVEKKKCGRDPGEGRSNEDEAVVTDDADADVSVRNYYECQARVST